MHNDLLDATDWAIAQKIADPAKVAIMGGSYGGYATLVGLTLPGQVHVRRRYRGAIEHHHAA